MLESSWWDRALKEAEKRLAEEPELLKDAYSPDFAKYSKETNLFFSFGDIRHLIYTGVSYNMSLKRFGASLQLAHYETLIKRFKLYLLQELKRALANKEPFKYDRGRDLNFVSEFLDLLKELDRMAEDLKKLREEDR